AGGIELVAGGKVVIAPGCCCGLEMWREWIDFADGGHPPWCGHDTGYDIERRASGALAVNDVEVAPSALRAAVARVESDLRAFATLLRHWAAEVAPAVADRFVDAFVRDMRVER